MVLVAGSLMCSTQGVKAVKVMGSFTRGKPLSSANAPAQPAKSDNARSRQRRDLENFIGGSSLCFYLQVLKEPEISKV